VNGIQKALRSFGVALRRFDIMFSVARTLWRPNPVGFDESLPDGQTIRALFAVKA
jgi:hypothetical protein